MRFLAAVSIFLLGIVVRTSGQDACEGVNCPESHFCLVITPDPNAEVPSPPYACACDCGEEPASYPLECADGSVIEPTSVCRDQAGFCGWETIPVVCPEDDPCQGAPCGEYMECVYEPKACFTDPCPQYGCSAFDECSNNPCPSYASCTPSPKSCFTTPCPQYSCVTTCDPAACGAHIEIIELCWDGSYAGYTDRCLSTDGGECTWEMTICPEQPTDPCDPNPCAYGEFCRIPEVTCAGLGCPQYECYVDVCASNPCETGFVCEYDPKACFTTPCPQYTCLELCEDARDCGPAINMPNAVCSDGVTVSGPTGNCIKDVDSDEDEPRCAWQIVECPADYTYGYCDDGDCGPEPQSVFCWDGSIAGPTECIWWADGGCQWQVTECPENDHLGDTGDDMEFGAASNLVPSFVLITLIVTLLIRF